MNLETNTLHCLRSLLDGLILVTFHHVTPNPNPKLHIGAGNSTMQLKLNQIERDTHIGYITQRASVCIEWRRRVPI